MIRSLYTASTGMYAQQMNVDILAHNMSNVTTTGFKRQRIEFQDLLYQNIRRPIAKSLRAGFWIHVPVKMAAPFVAAVNAMHASADLLPMNG